MDMGMTIEFEYMFINNTLISVTQINNGKVIGKYRLQKI